MKSFHSLAIDARGVAGRTKDKDLRALAMIVSELCDDKHIGKLSDSVLQLLEDLRERESQKR